jgi:hypothetical protein
MLADAVLPKLSLHVTTIVFAPTASGMLDPEGGVQVTSPF